MMFSADTLQYIVIIAALLIAAYMIVARAILAADEGKASAKFEEFLEKTLQPGILLFGLSAIALMQK
jgi:hypothetical protein